MSIERIPRRAPREYKPGLWGSILAKIDKAVRDVSGRVGDIYGEIDRLNRTTLQITERIERETGNDITGSITFSQYEVGGLYASSSIVVETGFENIGDIAYRSSDSGNISDGDPWVSIDPNGANSNWVADAGQPNGGGWRILVTIPQASYRFSSLAMEIRVTDTDGLTRMRGAQNFDPDIDPEFQSFDVTVGQWNNSTGKWKLWIVGKADEDTMSIGWNSQATTDFAVDSSLSDSDTPDPANTTTLSASDKRFETEIGEYDPSVPGGGINTVYVIARACRALAQGSPSPNYRRRRIDMPLDPRDPSVTNAGSLLAGMLEDAAQRHQISISAEHHGSTPDVTLPISGSIIFADTTPKSFTLQDYSLGIVGTGYYYFYYDPGHSESQLNQSLTAADALDPDMVFVGIARAAQNVGDRAFFSFLGGASVITAPFIYAVSLEAMMVNATSAKTGSLEVTGALTLTGGNVKLGEDVLGSGNHGMLVLDGSNDDRVKIGNVTGSDYGIIIYAAGGTGTEVLNATGSGNVTIGNLEITGGIEISSGGQITNAGGDYVLNDSGLDIEIGATAYSDVNAVTWDRDDSTDWAALGVYLDGGGNQQMLLGNYHASKAVTQIMADGTHQAQLDLEGNNSDANAILEATSGSENAKITVYAGSGLENSIELDADYVKLTSHIRLFGVSAPGGVANYGSLYADTAEKPNWYKGSSGPYPIAYDEDSGLQGGTITEDDSIILTIGGIQVQINCVEI